MRRKIPVQQGEIYRVRIVNLTYQGLGVAKVHDFPIFVANSLPGEIARVRVIRVKRHFSFGMVLRLFFLAMVMFLARPLTEMDLDLLVITLQKMEC